jgi:hypothetical protein
MKSTFLLNLIKDIIFSNVKLATPIGVLLQTGSQQAGLSFNQIDIHNIGQCYQIKSTLEGINKTDKLLKKLQFSKQYKFYYNRYLS